MNGDHVRSNYAYAAGNPISRRDPLGLIVQVVGSSSIATAQLQAAYNQVAGTFIGGGLTQALEQSSVLYTITDDPLQQIGAAYIPSTNTLVVDPNFHPTINVRNACGQSGYEAASTAIILAHELGHAATGLSDGGPDPGDNVNQIENPIRLELGLPVRTSYRPVPGFSYYPSSPW